MTDKARELLRRALEALEADDFYDDDFAKFRTLPREIRAYLALEERKEGVRWAEEYHGVGGGE